MRIVKLDVDYPDEECWQIQIFDVRLSWSWEHWRNLGFAFVGSWGNLKNLYGGDHIIDDESNLFVTDYFSDYRPTPRFLQSEIQDEPAEMLVSSVRNAFERIEWQSNLRNQRLK